MAAASNPPGTLPPGTHFRHGHSAYGAAAEPHGRHYSAESLHQSHYEEGGHSSRYPPPSPPPPPPYGSPRSPGHLSAAPSYSGGPAATPTPHAPALPSTTVYVAPPEIEMQPWARNAWRWLVDNTTGVARVDLRRPTPPLPEQYGGNLLVVRSRQSVATQRDSGRGGGGFTRETVPVMTYVNPVIVQPYPAAPQAAVAAAAPPQVGSPLLMGARIKITRSFIIGGGGKPAEDTEDKADSDVSTAGETEGKGAGAAADAATTAAVAARRPWRRQFWRFPARTSPRALSWACKPLMDIGVGINLDVDQQQIQPVARIKIKDLLSIKAAPLGLLQISRSIPLGPVALKVRYELPLAHARHFWEPPARLMVRLDNAAGSGMQLTPGGLEFDEQVLQFGSAVSLRASASLLFPRQLPLEEGQPPLRLQLHRLSLRSIW